MNTNNICDESITHYSNVSAISWREKDIFEEMIRMFTLNYSNALSWVFIMQDHCNNSPRVDMSLTSDT